MRPPNAWRLYAAAALCFLSLGMAWRTSLDFGPQMGWTLPSSYMGADGYYYTAPSYGFVYYGAEGVEVVQGFRSDERAVLVPAAVVLAVAATVRTRSTRRAAKAALIGVAALAAIACSRGRVPAAVTMIGALWLAVPVVVPDWIARLGRHRSLTVRPTRQQTVESGPPAAGPPATGSAF